MSTAATAETTDLQDEVEMVVAPEPTFDERIARNDALVRKHALAAAGVGLIPLPAVDFLALTGVQANLLRKLSAAYDVPFSEELGKKLVGSLVGGYAPVALAMPVASLLKSVPLIGQTTGVLAMSIVAGASTYAIGKVFVQHFESGGTFLNFDPAAVREYFREQFREGREFVSAQKKAKPKAGESVAEGTADA